eukprot:gene39831-biopygen26673
MEAPAAHSVGLGGDGDEVAAIREVEAAFGVTLDYGDAPNWRTAGDVYAALRRALPPAEAELPDVWERFAEALCRETGISPSRIGPESPLLATSGPWVRVAYVSLVLGIALAGAIIFRIG